MFPGDDVLHNLPFPLPSPALTIKDANNVVLTTESIETWVNGTQVTVELAVEKPVSNFPRDLVVLDADLLPVFYRATRRHPFDGILGSV